MGHILIMQRCADVTALLAPGDVGVQVSGMEELERELAARQFDAAIVEEEHGEAPREILRRIAQIDSDLAVVWVSGAEGGGAFENGSAEHAWDAVRRPLAAGAIRSAIQRARRHTAVLRENRALRNQSGQASANGASNGNGFGLHWIQELPPRLDLRSLLSNVEKSVIQRTLEATHGAQAEAARRLGLSRSDLSYKLTKYELRKPAERPS